MSAQTGDASARPSKRARAASGAGSQSSLQCQVCHRTYDRLDHLNRHLDSRAQASDRPRQDMANNHQTGTNGHFDVPNAPHHSIAGTCLVSVSSAGDLVDAYLRQYLPTPRSPRDLLLTLLLVPGTCFSDINPHMPKMPPRARTVSIAPSKGLPRHAMPASSRKSSVTTIGLARDV